MAAAPLAALLLGAAACTAVVPAPSGSASRGATALESPQASPSRETSTAPRPSPSAPARFDTLDLAHETLDAAWTDPILQFASDGESVIFSSGVADGPDGAFAPDLWRYTPGAEGPEMLWRNPRRDRSLVLIAGEWDLWGFVEMPLDNTRAWNLWLLTEPGGEAIHLDAHPGDEDVPSVVPSFVVHDDQVAWTAFDRGPDGPVSQLLYAVAPDWEPRVIAERPAREAELWFPSLRGTTLAYTEAVYSPDGLTDERRVWITDVGDPAAQPVRVDTSGLAVMPLLVDDGVIWKEADAGFSMFNWGRLFFYDLRTAEVSPVSMRPQEYVNYPSAGLRFVAAWGSDAFSFAVYDVDRETSRVIARYDHETNQSVFRPHVEGNLLVWLYTTVGDTTDPGRTELRYAYLPGAGDDRLMPQRTAGEGER
jgi:hypothetical protein